MRLLNTLLISAAIALVAAPAMAQTTLVTEYDFNRVAGANEKSGYTAAGVAQTTKYGTFDAYWQGIRFVDTNGPKTVDNFHGFEFGYGKTIDLNSVAINARIAYGTMGNINVGGTNETGHYILTSVEADKKLTNTFSGYVGYSYMHGLNTYSIHGSNRVQFGIDSAITNNLSLRTGGSFMRQQGAYQNGVVIIASYTL